jgi:hypothetical protein
MIDSTSVVSTGNAVVEVIKVVRPIVAGILSYIAGHKWTSRKKS